MAEEKVGSRTVAVLRRRPEPLVFFGYFLITAFMTYPAITLLSRTYAERRDPLGGLWWFWWMRYSFYNHLPVSPMKWVAVPFGVTMNTYQADPLNGLMIRGLTIIFNETVTYNVVLLLSYLAASVACYYLVRHLTGSRPAAAVAGLIFGFSPYMLVQGKEHLSLLMTAWIPLFLLFLLRAWQKRNMASISACGAVFIILALFNFQYGLLTGVFTVFFMATLYLTGKPWKRRRLDTTLFWKALPVVTVVAAAVVLMLISLSHSPLGAEKAQVSVYQYSARPWDYLIPHAEGALFGGLTRGFISSHLHGGFLVENSLFLGYIPLALALLTVLSAVSRRGAAALADSLHSVRVTESDDVDSRPADEASSGYSISQARRLIYSFAASAFAALVLSLPPTTRIAGFKLYLPSYLMQKILPQYRAYARFGLVVMMCVAVLAGYGLALLLASRHFKKRAVLVSLILALLVLLEFTIVPPFYSLDTEAATGYSRWLKSRPGKPVAAIYPLYVKDDFQNYDYFFQQRLHQKKLVNGADPDSEGELYRQSILDLYHPATPGLLKKLGAGFVVVIPSKMASPSPPHLNYTFPTRFDPSRLPPGLKEVARPTDSIVYEITAPPAEFVPLFGAGSYQAYIDPDGRFWHPVTNGVVVDIQSSLDQPALCDIKLTAMSARALSRLTFEVNGKTLSQHEVPPWPTDVVLTDVVLSSGANTLVIKSDGRTANLTEVPYYSDVSAAMMLGNILVEKKP